MKTLNRPPTKNEYEAILAKFQENRLDDTVSLMEQIPAYRRKTPLFRQQLSALYEAEIRNLTPEISRNNISNGLLSFIQIHEPQEAYTPPVIAANQSNSQTHIITNYDDSLLWTSKNFLGRIDKIAEIKALLDQPEGTNIIVTGMAGNGKTTICHHLLKQWLKDLPDRVVYLVEVEFITTIAGLARALGGLCGLTPEMATTDNALAALTDLPNGILYLDNLESVLDDPKAYQFLGQLKLQANLTILASSRREVADFTRVRLDVLDEPDAVELFQLIWQQQTGQRIKENDLPLLHDFVSTDMGYHPLSLEVTASHSETVGTLQQLVEEFRDSSTTYFTRYASDEQGRLNNLYQSLGLSFNRLKDRPNALRLLALCAVYESGLSGPMQKILLQKNVFNPADRSVLIQRNLVRNAEGFLSILPPVVRFIRSVLAAGDGLFDEGLLFQDGDHIAKAKLIPVPNRLEFLDFYADSHRYELEPVVSAFDNFDFQINRYMARPILERLAQNEYLSAVERQKTLGDVLINLGEFYFHENNNDKAIQHYLKADELYRKTGDDEGQANVLVNLADIDFWEGNNNDARKRFLQADELFQKNGNKGRARVLRSLGEIDFKEGNVKDARKRYQQAGELFRKPEDDQGRANLLTNLGEIDLQEENIDEARKHFLQADELYRKTGDNNGRAIVLVNLGEIDLQEENIDEARKRFLQADKLYQETGSDQGRANVLINLGEILLLEENTDEARKRFLQADNLLQKTGDEGGRAKALFNLGKIDFQEENIDEARKRYEQAGELYLKSGDDLGRAQVLISLGEIDFQEENIDGARRRYHQADELYHKSGDDGGRAVVLINLGKIDFWEDNNEDARKRFLLAGELCRKIDDDHGRGDSFHYLANLAQEEIDYPAAKADWEYALKLYRKASANRAVAETLLYLAEVNVEIDSPVSEIKEILTEAEQLIIQYNITSSQDKLTWLKSQLNE